MRVHCVLPAGMLLGELFCSAFMRIKIYTYIEFLNEINTFGYKMLFLSNREGLGNSVLSPWTLLHEVYTAMMLIRLTISLWHEVSRWRSWVCATFCSAGVMLIQIAAVAHIVLLSHQLTLGSTLKQLPAQHS